MLREGMLHADWCDRTMSMMREKQFEACERRLFAHPGICLFSPEATELDVPLLLECSYEEKEQRLVSLAELRARVMVRLPLEVLYTGVNEMQMLERLLINDGEMLITDWDDIGAAEALVRRLWCGFRAEGEEWKLILPKALHEPLMTAMHSPTAMRARELLFRFDATIHGLLYIAGLLHSAQPLSVFLQEVMQRSDAAALQVAKRYLQSTFEYITDAQGDLILLHPGLADPYQMFRTQPVEGIFTLELSQELIAGGMNGLLPEEVPLHEALCGALQGAMRPEFELADAAEDLRMLAKQGVPYEELEAVMASMLAVLPTEKMKTALRQLHLCTPHWMGLRTALMQ